MAAKNAREVALDALVAWQTGGVWSARKLSDAIVRAGLDKRDAALTTYLCGGVIQNMLLLDYHIAKHSSVRLKKLETRVLCLLRLGAFQLLIADAIPPSAAVNETVALCAKRDRRTAGFVNAVLRAISKIEDPYMVEDPDPVRRMATRRSHPEWICRELIEAIGPEAADRVLEADNTAPPVTVQVNTLRVSAEQTIRALEEAGAEARPHAFLPNAVDLTGTGAVDRLKPFEDGWFWVQDAASMLAVTALDPKPGDRILDACSAPGGKSFAAAVLSGSGAEITAQDVRAEKLQRIRDGAARLGIPLHVRQDDARVFRPEEEAVYDKIICDVPCSGLGIIRKKPDIRYNSAGQADALPPLQSEILQNVSRYLKPGGLLLFSTCTWRKSENSSVIRSFLEKNPAFRLEPFTLPDPIGHCGEGMTTLWPVNFAFDGFFICLMRKNHV